MQSLPNSSNSSKLFKIKIDFNDIVWKLQNQYNQKLPLDSDENKVILNESDFNRLSKYELQTIKTVANIYGLLAGTERTVSFDDLINVVNKLGKYKTDTEKNYLIGVFFPERVKNIHQINPFPYFIFYALESRPTLSTKISHITFLQTRTAILRCVSFIFNLLPPPEEIEMICPYLADSTVPSTMSNLYICTDSTLDGTTLVSGQSATAGTSWTAMSGTKVAPGWFNTGVLLFSKIGLSYVGRSDVESGYFGASFHVSTLAGNVVDPSPSQFDYVNRSINGCVAPLHKGMNAIFYPPDYSYLNFMPILSSSQTAIPNMSTNVRLNLYGTSLPTSTLARNSVVLSVNLVWNVIPSPTYADLLPLDYNIEDQTLTFQKAVSIVPKANLATFTNHDTPKIDNLIAQPSILLQDAVENFNIKDINYSNDPSKKSSAIDHMHDPSFEHPKVYLNKESFYGPKEIVVNASSNAKSGNIDALNDKLNSRFR